MKVFIIEDEIPTQINLKRALRLHFDDIEFVGTADSIVSAVEWLSDPDNQTDIVFMDVELSDGVCFEIFNRVKIDAKVIITTAYDNYAIKAFKYNCVDYLLKPIDNRELVAAVERCRAMIEARPIDDAIEINPLPLANTANREYKQRFVVKIGDHIIVIPTEDIAYFISKEKTSYIITKDAKSYIADYSLDTIETLLDPKYFFRVSRACITHISAIVTIAKHFSGRIRITLNPKQTEDVFISRVRTNDFMRWING